MNADQAINQMIESSGKSRRRVSQDIGRHPNFITVTLNKGSVPRADTLAAIAGATGYELVLRGNGDEIVIDPPVAD